MKRIIVAGLLLLVLGFLICPEIGRTENWRLMAEGTVKGVSAKAFIDMDSIKRGQTTTSLSVCVDGTYRDYGFFLNPFDTTYVKIKSYVFWEIRCNPIMIKGIGWVENEKGKKIRDIKQNWFYPPKDEWGYQSIIELGICK